jgi:glycosyltransferase involved in cell wall biosynthesis
MLSSQQDYYGGEVHLHDLAGGLAARGHRVSCLVRPGSTLASRLRVDALTVHELPLGHWYQLTWTGGLRRRLSELAPDILHTHLPRDYYLGATATLGLPISNVGTRHQLHPIALRWLKTPFLRRFAAMIAVSEAVRVSLAASGWPAERLVTVPNGVPLSGVWVSPAAVRHTLGLVPDGGPHVGAMGRLCPTKGLDILVRAVARLQARWPALTLVFVGDDPTGEAYEQQLADLASRLGVRVRFCGYQAEAARFLPAFDVLAVPSRAEPFGLVTAEALARGVPVVATRAGGSGEIIRDGVDGLLVPPDDPTALAAALERLLADDELHARCAAAGPERVASAFSIDRQVAATERVYERVVAGQPPGPSGA